MSNTNQNLLNQVLAELAITEIMEALTTVESALPTATLTDEQRRELNSINVDNKVFAEEVLDEMNTNPMAAVNGTYNKEFLANDLSLFEQTESILSRLTLARGWRTSGVWRGTRAMALPRQPMACMMFWLAAACRAHRRAMTG
ncbi:hypothetical protein QRD02_00005 [Aequorivita sp. SDUM287046]|uniref:Uncharacterized protein n=1 Tax=Aequorivita aurantiaca TaxID=3053356 RepID=A0ABT8DCE3_9FLAO|nr:hypothetical protein [Aequorivita aurantiaca]MDN3722747.1 hypothetical protein [Aequorivita aurantiaca]